MNHDKSHVGSSYVADEIDVGYVIEELGSTDPNASNDDKGPKYDKFVMAEGICDADKGP